MIAGGTNFVEKYSYAKPNRVVAILKAREAGTAERLQCKIE